MNTSDQAGDLNAAPLPIPTAQRIDIFVAAGVPPEALPAWVKQTGTSTFWHPCDCKTDAPAPSTFCGICLFVVGSWGYLTRETWLALQPFFLRAGAEANVFEYSSFKQNFIRRDLDWCIERLSNDPIS